MADLFWPGDERAGAVFSSGALFDAMVAVEEAWLGALVEVAIAPAEVAVHIAEQLTGDDLRRVAERAEVAGNPVPGLVSILRERLPYPAAGWVHRGLTSQDVLDSAVMTCLADAVARVLRDLRAQSHRLEELCVEHRATLMTGRTLTQAAVPITFGLKVASWLSGTCAAGQRLLALTFPVQVGGAAGTQAATVELARLRGVDDPARAAAQASEALARRLGLAAAVPWQTERSAVTAAGDALVAAADAWGHIAGDVTTLCRPEIGELHEGQGGGSSTMPHKSNPVLATLLTRHALTAPGLVATLHQAARAYVDERPSGAWHAEWDALRTLARHSVVAGGQATELLAGLQVDADRMRANLAVVDEDLGSERRSLAAFLGGERSEAPLADYLGLTDQTIDAACVRSREIWSQPEERV